IRRRNRKSSARLKLSSRRSSAGGRRALLSWRRCPARCSWLRRRSLCTDRTTAWERLARREKSRASRSVSVSLGHPLNSECSRCHRPITCRADPGAGDGVRDDLTDVPTWVRFHIGVKIDDVTSACRPTDKSAKDPALSGLRIHGNHVESTLKATARVASYGEVARERLARRP